jgi:hypothetical protein
MSFLKIWNGEEQFEGDIAWIVLQDDEELFRSAISEGSDRTPAHCVVSGRASKRPAVFLKAFQYQLGTAGAKYDVDLDGIDADAGHFFFAWEELVAGVNSLDPLSVKRARIAMGRSDARQLLLWKTESLLELLEDYVGRARSLVSEESPLGRVPLSGRRNDWWESSCVWARSFEALAQRVSAWEGSGVLFKPALIDPLSSLRTLAHAWKPGVAESALSAIWPYFTRAAMACMSQGKFNLVVLYVHRALDAYFQMYGVRERVVVAGDGLSYRYPRSENEMVTLCGTERRLVREAGWLRDSDRASFLREINRARNLLRETHGVYDCSEAEARLALSKFETVVRRMGDPSEVARLVESKVVWPNLSPLVLFDVEDGFQSFIVHTDLGSARPHVEN